MFGPRCAAEAACESDWDIDEDELYPGDGRCNPSFHGTHAQWWQWHVFQVDTYAEVTAGRKGVSACVEDMKTGQKCSSGAAERKGDVVEAGYLDNRNTSVRVVITDPKYGEKTAKKWYREDAGGHRQSHKPAPGNENINNHAPAGGKLDYDTHESPQGGDALNAEYGVRYGKTARASIIRKDDKNGMSYAFVSSRSDKVTVSLRSDKYGRGKWVKAGFGNVQGVASGRAGVAYNKHDQLKVCVKGPNGGPKCGKWHKG